MDALVMFAATQDPGWFSWFLSTAWVVLGVAAGLGFVIFVHELGHFLVAKACGVKCEKFYIGFDLFNLRLCRFQWGETEYGIGVLPLGGYVKMLGQDDDPRQAAAEMERCKVAGQDDSEAARAAALAEGTAAEGLTPGKTIEQSRFELDPRSYPAKPVWARMAIISAGVTMNVIFGVLLAACAYKLGVPETPAIVGSTVPGTPAWTADMRPGMRFIRFGNRGETYDHYRFEDVQQNVAFTGDDRKLEFAVRTRDGEEKTFAIQPSSRTIEETKLPTVGFQSAPSTRIGEQTKVLKHLAPITDVPLLKGDVIIAINGISLLSASPGQEVFDYRLNAELACHPDEPVVLTIERTPEAKPNQSAHSAQPQRLQVVVERKPHRVVGLQMKIGPIVAVREGSPAQKAGFQSGDMIQKVNGEEIGDPLSLGQRLIPESKSEKWTFIVARKDAAGKEIARELTVHPEMPDQYEEDYPLGGPVSIESIGVAYDVSNVVQAVEPGSPAANADLQPGDVVIKARFQAAGPTDEKVEETEIFQSDEIHRELVLDNNMKGWTRIHTNLQGVLPTTKLMLTIRRGNSEKQVSLSPTESTQFYQESRGLVLMPVSVIHKARSWSEALSLGSREVKERVFDVVSTISALVTGRVSARHLTGPAGIIAAAGYFASQGLPKLLIFLTILSANLAVLNILPIPVLDGGHLLFLAWEGITRKPVNPNVQGYLSLAGLVLLLSLMIFATAMDFNRFFS